MTPELSRPVRVESVFPTPREMTIDAEPVELEALAARFGLPSLNSLHARLALFRRGSIVFAKGTLAAKVVQSCVVTEEPVPANVVEDFEIAFQPAPEQAPEGEEIELSESQMDVVFYDGASIDVGEAVAETLSLSLDPYPRAPGAEEALRNAGIRSEADAAAERETERAASSPFAILRKAEP